MNTDARGHTISTDSAQAAGLLSNTIEAFAERQAKTGDCLKQALEADPSCALSQAVMGLMLHGARTDAFQININDALQSAKKHSTNITSREQLYIDALEFCVSGSLETAVGCFESILENHPTDLLALVFLQSELFWLGDMVRSKRVSTRLLPHWNSDVPGYPAFLAIRAFDLEESNAFQEAEQVAQEALILNPGDVWGAHAFAHVMYMQNRMDEGIAWMAERESLWQNANQMQFHLAWHQCLFLAERTEHEMMLNIYDTRIRNRDHELCKSMPDLYIDLQNGSSMLWRLEQVGVDVGHRWKELAEVCTPRIDDMRNPFTSAHFALVLAANEQFDDCDRLIQSMDDFSAESNHDLAMRYQKAALPAAKAAIAHRKGEHEKVVSVLKPAQSDLFHMGGSHAQQDIYFQLLADSTAQLGDSRGHAQLMHVIEKIGFVEPLRRVGYARISETLK